MYMLGEKFGGGVGAFEFGKIVEILVVERRQRRLQRVERAADIDHDAVSIELVGDEGRIDDKGRAMQSLRRAEHGTAERMSDHDVVANFNGKQSGLLKDKQ